MELICKGCGATLRVMDSDAGSLVRCPSCDAVTRAPLRSASAQAVARRQAAKGEAKPCPFCGRAINPGTVVCRNCGFNTQTGERVQDARHHAHAATPAHDEGSASGDGGAGYSEGGGGGRPAGGRAQFFTYRIRAAAGQGGEGQRLRLRRPLSLEFGPLGATVYGRTTAVGRTLLAAGLAVAASLVTATLLTIFYPGYVVWTAPAAIAWYLVFAWGFERLRHEAHKLSSRGHVVFDDDLHWLSLELYSGQWFSFVPIRGRFFWRVDRQAYEEIKGHLEELAEGRVHSMQEAHAVLS